MGIVASRRRWAPLRVGSRSIRERRDRLDRFSSVAEIDRSGGGVYPNERRGHRQLAAGGPVRVAPLLGVHPRAGAAGQEIHPRSSAMNNGKLSVLGRKSLRASVVGLVL